MPFSGLKQYVTDYRAHLGEWKPVFSWEAVGAFLGPAIIGILIYLAIRDAPGYLRLTRTPSVDGTFEWITHNVKSIFYGIYVCLFAEAFYRRDWPLQRLVWRGLAAQIIFSGYIVYILKNAIGAARPFAAAAAYMPFAFRYDHQAFPSGHTVDIFISTLPLALYYRERHPWVFLVCSLSAALVAFSRMWLFAHSPADVLGGVALGCIGAYFAVSPAPAHSSR